MPLLKLLPVQFCIDKFFLGHLIKLLRKNRVHDSWMSVIQFSGACHVWVLALYLKPINSGNIKYKAKDTMVCPISLKMTILQVTSVLINTSIELSSDLLHERSTEWWIMDYAFMDFAVQQLSNLKLKTDY